MFNWPRTESRSEFFDREFGDGKENLISISVQEVRTTTHRREATPHEL